MPSRLFASPLPRHLALAAATGSMAVLAFAPFALSMAAILALALFYERLAEARPRHGFLIGWVFGIGLMGFGIFWIRISLNEYGNMPPWLAYLMTFLLVVVMALYYAIAGALVSILTSRLRTERRWCGPLLVFPGAWVLTEWLRSWLFTGFPWLSIGYTQIDAPLAGLAPIGGVYAISLAVALCAGLLWGLTRWRGRSRLAALAALILTFALGLALNRVDWTVPEGDELLGTVVQANIPQALKWDPDARIPTLSAYLELTRDHWDSDLILWPETAVPDFLHQVRKAFIEPLAEEAREHEAELVVGIPVLDLEAGAYYNGLVSIGSVEDRYLKRHLVPFGEFIPFKDWLGPLGKAFEVPMSDFSAGTVPRPLLQIGAHQVGASICYEDVFPEEVSQALPDAAYLVNVSNDAWFGDSLAPHQHLQMARMRSLENQRWMLRATNTGISAILDHRGKVVGIVPSFERGAFSAQIQPRRGATPFVYLGNALPVATAASMLILAVALGRRRRRFPHRSSPTMMKEIEPCQDAKNLRHDQHPGMLFDSPPEYRGGTAC